MGKMNNQRPSRNEQRTANRNNRQSDGKYWIIGSVVVLALVSIYLFSRNEHKDRLSAQQTSTAQQDSMLTEDDKGQEQIRSPRTIHMRKGDGGVYYVPMRVNGQELEFIFDTGASSICISRLEAALLLKQGRISAEDQIGESQATLADGSTDHGTRINLREVELAGVTLRDVEADISDNTSAPLLLGQSAMSRFGSFKVDYKKQTITFE